MSGLPDRANKTVEGNGFALGWVRTVGQTVKAFAASAEQTAALELYESKEFKTSPGKAQVVKAGDAGYIAGREAAIGESLFRPMKGAAAPLSLN